MGGYDARVGWEGRMRVSYMRVWLEVKWEGTIGG